MKEKKIKYLIICALILISVLFRCVPHLPQFAPIVALALFGGYFLQNRALAILLVFTSMLLSDLIIGIHIVMWATYLSLAIIVCLGSLVVKFKDDSGNQNKFAIIGSSILSSTIFFLITNFAVWYSGWMESIYPFTLSGLATCYVAGIPFFGYSLASDLCWTIIIWLVYSLSKQRIQFKCNN